MLDPGGDCLDAGRLEPPNDFRRLMGGRQVEVAGMLAEQKIAHRPADEAGMASLRVERFQQPLDAGAVEPFLRVKLHGVTSPSRRDRLTSIAAVAPQMG